MVILVFGWFVVLGFVFPVELCWIFLGLCLCGLGVVVCAFS